MNYDAQILIDAVNNLKRFTGKQIDLHLFEKEYDAQIKIDGVTFIVEIKNELRASNKGIFFAQLENLKLKTSLPIMIIAKYIASEVQEDLKEKNINYIDINANAFINEQNLFIYISGQKPKRFAKTNQSRAFQEAGIKLIYFLLINPEYTNLSYRALAGISKISVGSVSNIMLELEELNFILKTKTERKLKNIQKLLHRWIIAYHDVLRPRLLKKQMRFADLDNYFNWDNIPVQDADDTNLWGGEPAAAMLTGHLKPEIFTIYTSGTWQNIAAELKLIPDDKGKIEILQIFWNEAYINKGDVRTHALLIYADLMGSGDDRNIETAKLILENELQHIR